MNLIDFRNNLYKAIETARLANKKRAYIFKTNDCSMLNMQQLQQHLADPDDFSLPDKNKNRITLFGSCYYTDESHVQKELVNQQKIIDCFKPGSIIKKVYEMLVKLKFKPKIDVFMQTDFYKAALVQQGKLSIQTTISNPVIFISVTVYKSRVKKIC